MDDKEPIWACNYCGFGTSSLQEADDHEDEDLAGNHIMNVLKDGGDDFIPLHLHYRKYIPEHKNPY